MDISALFFEEKSWKAALLQLKMKNQVMKFKKHRPWSKLKHILFQFVHIYFSDYSRFLLLKM